MTEAGNFAKQIKGLDTSGVEVDEEQEVPSIAANSPEEAALVAELEGALKAAGDESAINASAEVKLMCLRGRKYDVARAAALIPKHMELKDKLLELDRPDNQRLKDDLNSHKVVCTGGKDADGRAIIWIRLRYHDPKQSKAQDMARLIVTVMSEALKDPDVQRMGIVLINDVNGVKLKNLDPAAIKFIMGNVLPAMPVRVARICIFNPPWILGHVVFPIVFSFMSKKLRGRIAVLNGDNPEKLHPYIPSSALPAEHGGTLPFDEEAWSAKMVAGLQVAAPIS